MKFEIGERVRIKTGTLQKTADHCGIHYAMKKLRGNVSTVELINDKTDFSPLSVKCSNYWWHPDDLEKIEIKPKPKGGSFKIENLVR